MTQRGQHSHYNVKFLKGYGFSVSVKDNKLVLKNNYDPFSESQTEEWLVKNMPYEKIVLSGKGYVSTEALSLLSENYRNIILLDNFGKPVTFMNGMMDSLTATHYRIGQYDTFRDPLKRKYLTHQVLKAKKESQIKLLKIIGSSRDSLPEKESSAGRIYFIEFAKAIPEKYGFSSRNHSVSRISKNHATDIINSLLNYGYSVLAGEISKYVCGIGLDPYFGFMHRTHTGFQPLVYDLIEPFRWLVDYSVFKIANNLDHTRRIRLKDYARTRDGKIVIEYDLIKRFLELLERNFQMERRYAFRHGAKTRDGLKSCQEITIAKIAVQNLADFCLQKKYFEI